jgi:hypothetical protein
MPYFQKANPGALEAANIAIMNAAATGEPLDTAAIIKLLSGPSNITKMKQREAYSDSILAQTHANTAMYEAQMAEWDKVHANLISIPKTR